MNWVWALGLVTSVAIAQTDQNLTGRAHQRGPEVHEVMVQPDLNAYDLIVKAFAAVQSQFIGPGYAQSGLLNVRGNVDLDMPVNAIDARAASDERVDFSIYVDGAAAPNGHYRYDIEGGLGDLFVARNSRSKFTVSHAFKSFSDQPIRARSENAGLTSFQSLAYRKLAQVRNQILDSGQYRFTYGGTGYYGGRIVHIVRIFKPSQTRSTSKAPMPINKLWTFWHDGGYEVWIFADNFLPASIFYTNIDDNIYANLELDYDQSHMPQRISIQNNSIGFQGQGELLLDYREDRVLRGLRLSFDSEKGHSMRIDLNLEFNNATHADAFKVLPPFGYKKVNRDHLKLMLTTQIAGGLLQLKKNGVNLKNFKF